MQHVHFIGQRDLVQAKLDLRKCLFSSWRYVKMKLYFNLKYNKQQNKRYLEGDSQNFWMLNGRFKTTSGHFLPTTWISFTKLRFRQSFWGAKRVWILFGPRVMTKQNKTKKHTKLQKNVNGNICVLSHKFWTNWD